MFHVEHLTRRSVYGIINKKGGENMLNTFDALAKFPNENGETKADDNQQNDTNAAVDISAIINRLNEMETKINELVNKSTDIPTRGNDNNPAPDNGANNDNPAPDNGADDNKGE